LDEHLDIDIRPTDTLEARNSGTARAATFMTINVAGRPPTTTTTTTITISSTTTARPTTKTRKGYLPEGCGFSIFHSNAIE